MVIKDSPASFEAELHLLSLTELLQTVMRSTIENIDTQKLKKILDSGPQSVVILSHRNPDGDAIGASAALNKILLRLGHSVHVVIPNTIPGFLQWMPNVKKFIIHSKTPERTEGLLNEATVIFSLDFNDITRIREFESIFTKSKAYKVLIDHHPDPASFAHLTLSDTTAGSTCELLYAFIDSLGYKHLIDDEIASCIFTGIMTDTGCFSFNSSLPDTFQTVAELLTYKFNKDEVFDKVYNNFSYDRMRLMGYCLDKKMQVLPGYRTAYISLTQEEMRTYRFRIGDSEGFVNLPLSVEGICFSVLFIENKDLVRVSFRSKGDFPVNKIAADHFQGGGHKNAAGGESYDTLQNTVEKFIKLLPNYKDELLAN
jgi:bifunctional oligoribonuclease and PAP phosphatase NrnA